MENTSMFDGAHYYRMGLCNRTEETFDKIESNENSGIILEIYYESNVLIFF